MKLQLFNIVAVYYFIIQTGL